jgi:hypothetical protein
MAAPPPASLRAVADILERFLCPGGRLRLSPFVEAVQSAVLFGELPDPRRHAASLRDILERPEHAAHLHTLFQVFLDQSQQGTLFDRAFFSRRGCLDFYLTHYFPANVGKLQLVLLDVLRAGHFPAELHLTDLGVGTGTSFFAAADFVLALGNLADLLGIELPLRALTFRGYDRSSECLGYTRDAVAALRSVLEGMRELRREVPQGLLAPAPGGW